MTISIPMNISIINDSYDIESLILNNEVQSNFLHKADKQSHGKKRQC